MYTIKKASKKIECPYDSEWDKAEVIEIKVNNWSHLTYVPNTTAKLMYSDYGIHVRMETDEDPIYATHTKQNGDICTDSCMELFIRPNENDPRYINFEFNPFGTMYLGLCTSRYDYTNPDYDKYYFEVKNDVNYKKWVLNYTIPFEFINSIFGSYTKTMYANMYKCGDGVNTTHRVTCFPVGTEKPDFHRPEYFQKIVLE